MRGPRIVRSWAVSLARGYLVPWIHGSCLRPRGGAGQGERGRAAQSTGADSISSSASAMNSFTAGASLSANSLGEPT